MASPFSTLALLPLQLVRPLSALHLLCRTSGLQLHSSHLGVIFIDRQLASKIPPMVWSVALFFFGIVPFLTFPTLNMIAATITQKKRQIISDEGSDQAF